MATPYRKNALLGALGVEDEDPPQQIDPVGPRVETPAAPIGGGDRLTALGSISGPVDPAKRAAYDARMADITKRTQALDPVTGGPGLADLGREQEAAQREFFGAGYQGPAAANGPAAPGGGSAVTTLGAFADRMGPWNAGNEKFQRPWDQMSERYKMLTVLSNFDPRQGITPEVVEALNAANINGAKFSGSGDKLNATGLQHWRNYDGREGIGDIIKGFKTGNGTWQAWGPEGGGGGTGEAGGGLDPRLSGDPLAGIQAALSKLGSSANLDALLAQLGQVA